MNSSFIFDTCTLDGLLCILRGHRLKFPPKNCISLSEGFYVAANSEEPDEMQLCVAFRVPTGLKST